MNGLKKFFISHKNNKLKYYTGCILRELYPTAFCRSKLKDRLAELANYDLSYINTRVSYYNKLSDKVGLGDKAIKLKDLKIPDRKRVYYFDTFEFTRFFPNELRANFLFGDITHVPNEPAITKSRPIHVDNKNSVLLKLEKDRHFMFVKYDIPFATKKDMLIWRGVTGSRIQKREHRMRFMEMYFNNPLCDLGKINEGGGPDEWRKNKITINEHLNYKFILCLEGNDVASNLKWVMSSNSLAVMPKPKYETWFMEGTLKPDFHYVEIKDDYSDLGERLAYYVEHPDKAQQIVANANEYVNQFRNKRREELLSLLVLEKYFVKTGQFTNMSMVSEK